MSEGSPTKFQRGNTATFHGLTMTQLTNMNPREGNHAQNSWRKRPKTRKQRAGTGKIVIVMPNFIDAQVFVLYSEVAAQRWKMAE